MATCGVVALVAATLGACESTADKSKRLESQAKKAVKQTGLVVTRVNPDVKVVSKDVLTDENGTAVVAVLRNTGTQTLVNVPVAIDVRDRAGKSVFKNDSPGAEPALVSAPILEPDQPFTWVHDLVQAAGKPAGVEIRVGDAEPAPGPLPKVEVGEAKLRDDPVNGLEANGRLTNDSAVDQRRITIFATARRGDRVVAAGRGVINRARANKRARFSIFFIGNPKGAELELSAPPTVLR